ncbi:MAG: MFS transporter [Rhizobacter sp.]|nr:MFS transporter [Burkholderiales bacterium]
MSDTPSQEISTHPRTRSVWWWIPTLYFGQGIPYVAVMLLSVILYKNMGVSNTEIALYTSWLYLPFVIKPLWSPFVDMFRSKRWWIVCLELVIGAAFALVALTLPMDNFFRLTLAVFWLLAFAAATHDIASDGFYMLGLVPHEQAAYVGIRSTFFRLSMITGQGGLVYLAGKFTEVTGNLTLAWCIVFSLLSAMFLSLFVYHSLSLPRPANDVARVDSGGVAKTFVLIFAKFLKKKEIVSILLFLLLYRFAEAQLVKIAPVFMLDSPEKGGLGLSTATVGVVYGTIGMIALSIGGMLSAYLISRHGMKRWLWIMALAIHVPNLAFVYLAVALPSNVNVIASLVAAEQFGYGFGFTGYVLFMIMTAKGEHQTAHYAICTGFMALGMMLPGMVSGWLQTQLGYANFFIWVCVATIPGFLVTGLIKIEPGFGAKPTEP